jgi:hypothetical protein
VQIALYFNLYLPSITVTRTFMNHDNECLLVMKSFTYDSFIAFCYWRIIRHSLRTANYCKTSNLAATRLLPKKRLTLIRIQYILPTCSLSIIFLNNLRCHSLLKRQLHRRFNRKRGINLIATPYTTHPLLQALICPENASTTNHPHSMSYQMHS